MLYRLSLVVVFGCFFFFPSGAVSAQSDFFWSPHDLNMGAVNGDIEVTFSPEEKSGSIYLYYSAQGPSQSDLEVGAMLDISTSRPGVVRFTGAESFDFAITVMDIEVGERWTANGGAFGNIGSVSNYMIDEWGAFTFFGNGIQGTNNGMTFLDEGYDVLADAFLFGRVDFEIVGGGTIDIVTTVGSGQAVAQAFNCGVAPLAPVFGAATITSKSLFILGDVNMDGFVNLLDVQPFVNLLNRVGFQAEADVNFDGVVNLLDVEGFVDLIAGQGTGPIGGDNDIGPQEKGDCLIGDVNGDGLVNLFDVEPLIGVILADGNQCEADLNQDGDVNLLDIPCMLDIFSS